MLKNKTRGWQKLRDVIYGRPLDNLINQKSKNFRIKFGVTHQASRQCRRRRCYRNRRQRFWRWFVVSFLRTKYCPICNEPHNISTNDWLAHFHSQASTFVGSMNPDCIQKSYKTRNPIRRKRCFGKKLTTELLTHPFKRYPNCRWFSCHFIEETYWTANPSRNQGIRVKKCKWLDSNLPIS